MKIGVLVAEELAAPLVERLGSIRNAFRAMLDISFDLHFWQVNENVFPSGADECDGWVISGSSASAYDEYGWVERLRGLLRDAKGKRPMIGICFGHQLIADTFGGKAEPSPGGRIWGFHDYRLCDLEPWMEAAVSQRVAVAHGDQVTRIPPGAKVIASCEWTPYAALYYPGSEILTVQSHPEVTIEFRRALIEFHRGGQLTDEEADDRLVQCATPLNHGAIRQWINAVLARTSETTPIGKSALSNSALSPKACQALLNMQRKG